MTKKDIAFHEVGHLLFFLKNIYLYSNIYSVEYIFADPKKGGVFSHQGVRMPNECHLKRALGGIAMEVKLRNIPARRITKLSVIVMGWRYDVANCLKNGFTWSEVKQTIYELSKEITDDDMEFVYKVVSLFKGNTKTIRFDKLLPLMQEYLDQHPL